MTFVRISIILLLIAVSASFGQEDTGDYLVEVKFSIREEKIPAIINYLLNNSLEQHDITTADIIKLSKLDQSDLDAVVQVFNYCNITAQEVFTVDNLERLLESLNLEFPNFYRDLVTNLQIPSEKILPFLQALNISAVDFLLALSSNSGIYDTLRTGVYDQEHVDAALEAVGKTRNEVYTAARELIFARIVQLNSTEFMNILKSHGWDRKTALGLYKALNITTPDIYEVEKFRVIFTNISDSINRNVTLGVFIGKNKLVVHESAYNQSFDKVDGITVKAQANGIEIGVKKERSLGEGIIELSTTQAAPSYIEIVEFYNPNSTENCSYITINNGQVSVEKVVVDDGFTVQKNNRTEFFLGSPLVCEGRLYGLAKEEDANEIIFDLFYTEDNPPPEKEEEPELHPASEGHLISPIISFTFNLFMCLVFM